MKIKGYYKVPFRQSYCATFRQWVAMTILCHVVYRLMPPILPKIGLAILTLALAGIVSFTGCTTSQQTTTNTALVSIEATADASFQAYVGLVVKGQVSTNSLPQVAQAYNDLHAAINAANALNQSSTNALVPANVTAELAAFSTLITTITQGK